MKRIILLSIYILSIIFLVGVKIGNTPNVDYQIYGQLGYALMHGASYGHDIVDTKLDILLWLYALIMKVFTQGQPYFAILYFFTLIPLLISSVLMALISKKIFYKKIPLFLSTFIFLACTYQWSLNSEILVNVFTLLALYFFINKKGKFGNNFFLTGFFLGFSMLLRLTNGINILTFPLAYFLITYKKKNSFKQNIVSHIKQYPTYLKYALGCIFPFLLYFIYISYTNNWSGFYNYFIYIQNYNNIDYFNLTHVFFLHSKKLLHFSFLISMIVVYRHHKKLFVFSCVYFVLNLLISTFVLSHHFAHYYAQVILIYPFIMTQAIDISFHNFKNKKISLKSSPYIFIIILSFISLIYLPLNDFYHSYCHNYYLFIKKELSEKGYSYNNYLKASDKWLCKKENFCEEADFLKTFYPQSYSTQTDLYFLKENNGKPGIVNWKKLFGYIRQLDRNKPIFISQKIPERIIVASDTTHFQFKPYFHAQFKRIQNNLKKSQKLFKNQKKNISTPVLKKENYTLKKFKKTLSNGSVFNVWVWDLKKTQ